MLAPGWKADCLRPSIYILSCLAMSKSSFEIACLLSSSSLVSCYPIELRRSIVSLIYLARSKFSSRTAISFSCYNFLICKAVSGSRPPWFTLKGEDLEGKDASAYLLIDIGSPMQLRAIKPIWLNTLKLFKWHLWITSFKRTASESTYTDLSSRAWKPLLSFGSRER